MNSFSGDFRNILIVNVNWLGDAVFSIPVFRVLSAQFPEARLSCLAVPGIRDILECVENIDEILVYDEKGADRGLFAKIRLIKEIRDKKFDAVFLLHGSWTRAFMMFMAGIPVRVGHRGKKRGKFLTCAVPAPPENTHKSDSYLSLLEGFGIPVDERRAELTVSQSAREELNGILASREIKNDQNFIVVHTSGNWDLKRWPVENWAALIARIENELGIKVIISEGPKEREWAENIGRLSKVNPVILAGETNLKQSMALFEKSALVISADSGPLHIASCVGKRVIGLYGPTLPLTTGPRGPARSVILHHDAGCNKASCYYLDCPDNVCMKALSVGDVFDCLMREISSKTLGGGL